MDSVLKSSRLFGQLRAKKLLARSLSSGRVSHAYLFKGPEGVGKKTFGREVAATINCARSDGVGGCGSCSSCRKFQGLNHPDFLLVEPVKGVIKISQIRELCKALSYPPYESSTRVTLIQDVHALRQEAANALLKTLEEPPENNLLILTADSSRQVLPTILSRCQVIPFDTLRYNEVSSLLMAKYADLDEKEAYMLARLSEGSPGKAMLIQQEGLLDYLIKLTALLASPRRKGGADSGEILKCAEEIGGLKEYLSLFFSLLRLWLRDLLFVVEGQQELLEDMAVLPNIDRARLKNWSSDQLFARLRAIDQAEKELTRNCNKSLVCEVLLFKLQ